MQDIDTFLKFALKKMKEKFRGIFDPDPSFISNQIRIRA